MSSEIHQGKRLWKDEAGTRYDEAFSTRRESGRLAPIAAATVGPRRQLVSLPLLQTVGSQSDPRHQSRSVRVRAVRVSYRSLLVSPASSLRRVGPSALGRREDAHGLFFNVGVLVHGAQCVFFAFR
jgi:hypothetical protein